MNRPIENRNRMNQDRTQATCPLCGAAVHPLGSQSSCPRCRFIFCPGCEPETAPAESTEAEFDLEG